MSSCKKNKNGRQDKKNEKKMVRKGDRVYVK